MMIEAAVSSLNALKPELKQIEKMICKQMIANQHADTNHIFLHFDRQVARVESSCLEAIRQLEHLLTLRTALDQLSTLQACTTQSDCRFHQPEQAAAA